MACELHVGSWDTGAFFGMLVMKEELHGKKLQSYRQLS